MLTFRIDILDDAAVERLSGMIRNALVQNPDEVWDIARRTWREFNRIPWPSAFLRVFDQLPPAVRDAVVERLQHIALSGEEPENLGAVALLLGVAERLPAARDFLKTLYRQVTDEFARYLIGGYLRSYGIEPEDQASLVSEARAPYGDDHVALQRVPGFLAVYDAADDAEKKSLRALLAGFLLGSDEPAREFALDFLLDPQLRATVMAEFAPHVARMIWRLARGGGGAEPLQSLASVIMEMIVDEVEEGAIFIAARGDLRSLTPGDQERIYRLYVAERSHARSFDVAAVVDVEARPGFGPADYALLVWNLMPSIPVPLEHLAGQLGIVVRSQQFETRGFDSCLIRSADLPFFIAVINEASGNQRRRRFSLAHEIGHAVLPEHRLLAYACRINEGEASSPAEREADAFASALLMPARALRQDANVELDPEELDRLADKYLVSYTALVFNLVPLSPARAAVFYCRGGEVVFWKWSRSLDVRARGLGRLDRASLAYALLQETGTRGGAELRGEVPPEAWFDPEDWRAQAGTDTADSGYSDAVVYEAARLVHPGIVVSIVEIREGGE